MGDIDRVVNKNSKQLLSLPKSSKNITKLQCRVSKPLLLKHDVATVKKKKVRHRFRKHPVPISSESELSVVPRVKNGFSDSCLRFNFSKSSDLGTTSSEESTFSNNHIDGTKTKKWTCISTNPILYSQTSVSVKKISKGASRNTNKLKTHNSSSKMCSKPNNKCVPNSNTKNEVDQTLCRLMERILNCMEDIREIMETGIEPPDGAEDWERARKRTVEFEKRFTRNFLYELGQKMIQVEAMGRKEGKFVSPTAGDVHQCLLSVHKSILQTLEAYRCNMTTLLANTLAEKLLVVTGQTRVLCQVHRKYLNLGETGSTRREDLIDELNLKCKILANRAEDLIVRRSKIDAPISAPRRLSLMGYNVNQLQVIKTKPSKTRLESKLSMYSMSTVRGKRYDQNYKETTKMLTQEKLKCVNYNYHCTPSRYKYALFKHRPPPEKPTVINLGQLGPKCKFFGEGTSCLLQNTPVCSRQNEDDIETSVGMVKNRNGSDVTNESMVSECHASSYISTEPFDTGPMTMTQNQLDSMKDFMEKALLGRKINNTHDKGCEAKKNEYAPLDNASTEILEKFARWIVADYNRNNVQPHQGLVDEMPEKLVEQVKRTEAENELMERQNCAAYKNNSYLQNTTRVSFETETKQFGINHEVHLNEGRKTDHSQLYTNNNKRRQTVTVTGEKNAQLICIRDDDSIVENKKVTNTNKNCLKSWIELHQIQRKSLNQQLLFDPNIKMNHLVQYRSEYRDFTKGNIMYQKRSSSIQPWEVVSNIADDLVEDLVEFISKELLAEPLLDNMYISEFQ